MSARLLARRGDLGLVDVGGADDPFLPWRAAVRVGVGARDLPVLEGCVIVAAALFVVVQGAGLLLHSSLDPRARA